mmetsp:Transcript_36284/g.78965  ORF Transcript_36284/g.78965 Transcript_36284/m.78965 type:complete len:529 (-) Transcript_36284:501-2087(-)
MEESAANQDGKAPASDIGAGGNGMDGSNPAKKHARVGQWRTPPVPFFPSGSSPTDLPNAGGGEHEIPIPESPDGYAMALQEAYRQGAEAAASGGGGVGVVGMGSAVSCPDLSSLQPLLPPSGSHGTLASVGEEQEEEEPDPQMMAARQSAAAASAYPADLGSAGPGGPPSHQHHMHGGGGGGGAVPTPLPVGPMSIHPGAPSSANHPGQPHPHHSAPPPPPAGYGASVQTGYAQRAPQQSSGGRPPSSGGGCGGASRSVSLPDISSYAAQADAEEAKRRKRLARNRASARLRRLRKKNLVDSYEGEVGVLESSLAKLRAHTWGVGSDPTALLDALSMDRGQQHVDAEKRRELIRSILAQQREQVQNIRECQLENMVLGWVARRGEDEEQEKMADPEDEAAAAEEAELARELQDLLALSPEQKARLRKTTEGLEEERRAIDTVDACLEAMAANSWLLNAGVEECTDKFMSILNPTQTSKFLLWTDNNSEAIDQLDYVKAPPADAKPANTPIFYFGLEEGMPQGDDGGEG